MKKIDKVLNFSFLPFLFVVENLLNFSRWNFLCSSRIQTARGGEYTSYFHHAHKQPLCKITSDCRER